MAKIEVSASIRRTVEDISAFLLDLKQLPRYMPERWFRCLQPTMQLEDAATTVQLEVHFLGRWWPMQMEAHSERSPNEIAHIGHAPLTLHTRFCLEPQKADRRGPRTAVRLSVEYAVPGGALGRIVDGLLLEREVFKAYDQVMRLLPIALEGPPKSGLKHEAP